MSPATTRKSPGIQIVRRIEPSHERAVGNLRGKAGEALRVGAALRDFAEKIDDGRSDRDAGKLQCPFQDRDIGVESFGSEQRAARRTGDADDALDAEPALCHDLAKRFQRRPLRRDTCPP